MEGECHEEEEQAGLHPRDGEGGDAAVESHEQHRGRGPGVAPEPAARPRREGGEEGDLRREAEA